MFWGEYSHQMDEKGRIIIPARFRPYLATGAILTRGLDHNLVIYPQDAWRVLCDQLNQYPITHATGRAMRRLLFSGAVELTYDKHGRMLIPAYLRDYASLSSEVLVIGMENFIELWEPRHWQSALNGVSHALAEAETMLNLSL